MKKDVQKDQNPVIMTNSIKPSTSPGIKQSMSPAIKIGVRDTVRSQSPSLNQNNSQSPVVQTVTSPAQSPPLAMKRKMLENIFASQQMNNGSIQRGPPLPPPRNTTKISNPNVITSQSVNNANNSNNINNTEAAKGGRPLPSLPPRNTKKVAVKKASNRHQTIRQNVPINFDQDDIDSVNNYPPFA